MILITTRKEGEHFWTNKVEYVNGRVIFSVDTKSGKLFKHSLLETEIVDIIDQDAIDNDEIKEVEMLPDFTK